MSIISCVANAYQISYRLVSAQPTINIPRVHWYAPGNLSCVQSVVCLSPCTQKRGIRASTAAGAAQPTAKEEAPNSGEHTTNDIGFQSDQLSHCMLDRHRQTHPKITAPAAVAPISGIRLTLDHCICYSEGCTKNVNLSWNRSRALDKIKTPLRKCSVVLIKPTTTTKTTTWSSCCK